MEIENPSLLEKLYRAACAFLYGLLFFVLFVLLVAAVLAVLALLGDRLLP